MKLDWKPARCAFIDFETQSEAELTTVHKYASHHTTRALTCVVKTSDGQIHRMGPYLTEQDCQTLKRIAETHTLVAHNAPFDAAIWEHTLKLPEATWFDTLPPARAAGYPGKLDELSKVLGGRGKDPNGKRLIDMLCIIRNGKYPAVGPAHKLLIDYNQQDVEELEFIYHKVKGFGEPDVMTVDRVINDRGIPIRRSFLEALLELYDTNETKLRAEFEQRTGGVNPSSAKQVKDWMKRMGFRVPTLADPKSGEEKESLGKFAYKKFLADPEDYYMGDSGDEEAEAAAQAMVDILETRREVVRVGKGKAKAALEGIEDDDRIREQFVYFGAHTGRWAGRKLQLHNMPHTVKNVNIRDMEPTYENAVAIAKEATEKLGYRVLVADVLGAMLRHLVQSDNLLIADYGAVEARGVAYVAKCGKMLNLYSDPHKSVYLDMGRQLFGRTISKKDDPGEYNMSKTLVLGCGYGMSGAKFEYTCKSRGVSTEVFEKAGMKASEAVKVYRETYPEISLVWKAYHDAIHLAVRGTSVDAGRCHFAMVGPDLHCVLPSGRPLVYRNARIEPRVPGWQRLYGMVEQPVDTVIYDSPRMKFGFLYGSKVAENVVQAMCRDFLAHTLVLFEQVGLKPFLHVHDEAGCEAPPERFAEFMEIMSTPPSWAPDFPLLVEGYCGPVWTKQSKGYKELVYQNGRAVDG